MKKISITGQVFEIIFHNPDNGYTVLLLETQSGIQTVVGVFPELAEGEEIRVTGEVSQHPRYGEQIKAEQVEHILPKDAGGIERYLASGLIRGVGPATASLLVNRFGEDTLRVIDEEPDRLHEIPGVGETRAKQIVESWREQKNAREIIAFLSSINVTTSLAIRICKVYGSEAVSVVQHNPYRLSYDVMGIGFKTADRLARNMGIQQDSSFRVGAGVVYCLREMADEGHVYAPRDMLEQRTAAVLEVEPALVSKVLLRMAQDDDEPVVVDGDAVYLEPYFRAEVGATENLARLFKTNFSRVKRGIQFTRLSADYSLNSGQLAAIEIALEHPVSVLTGGPGTGKSYLVHALIDTLEQMGLRYALCAPTGRAAKRLSEFTGREARTIHRLLGYVPGQDEFALDTQEDEEDKELNRVDFVVVDECSMVDIALANRLLRAIPDGCHILLVGDVDQLPPVGAGNFLRDVIDAGVIPVTRLTEIYRQEATSDIITNAHLVNRGEMPVLDNQGQDFFFFNADNGMKGAELIVDLVKNRIPRRFGLCPLDIQVLSPMHRGPAGIRHLNEILQDALNPPSPLKRERELGGTLFRMGDRVMQIKNNYEKGVFNGDLGEVVFFDEEDASMLVNMDGQGVTYEFSEAEQLVLAYAVTVHKSQGSEYPCVLMVMLPEHSVMLARNLLYTGITRSQKVCVLVSSRRALKIAISNNRVVVRYSALSRRLKNALS